MRYRKSFRRFKSSRRKSRRIRRYGSSRGGIRL